MIASREPDTTFSHIRLFFQENSALFKERLIGFGVFLLLLLSSGYAKGTASGSKDSYFLLFLVIVFFFVFIAAIRLSVFSKWKTNLARFCKKPNIVWLLFLVGLLSIAITMILNFSASNLMTYLHYFLLFVFGFIFVALVPFDKFVSNYIWSLKIFTILSLVVWAATNLLGQPAYTAIFTNVNGVTYYNLFNVYFSIKGQLIRNCGPFWEPGLFSSFLLAALVFEIGFKEKQNWFNVVIFGLGVLSTHSNAGMLLLLFLVPLYFCSRKELKGQAKWFFGFVIFALIVLGGCFLGAKLGVSFLSKFTFSGVSLSTRILSFYYDFLIFKSAPFFGVGPVQTDAIYSSFIASVSNLDSQTSTSLWLFASFGLFGFLLLLASFFAFINTREDKSIYKGVLLMIISFVIVNKEPHYSFSLFWIFLFYLFAKNYGPILSYDPFGKGPSSDPTIYQKLNVSQSNSKILIDNISGSLAVKGLVMLVGIFTLPAYITYFSNQAALGVWYSILSVLSWVLTFDMGVGNGLKNKIIDCLVTNDRVRMRKCISSAYASALVISGLFLVAGLISIQFIDFNSLFNISKDILSAQTLKIVVSLAFLSIALEFFFKLVLNLIQALQKQAIASGISLLSTVLLLIFVSTVSISNLETKTIVLASFYIVAINLPLIIASFVLFGTIFKDCVPSRSCCDKKTIRDVISLGGLFFFIQLLMLALDSTDTLLIDHFYNPSDVVTYQAYYKFFSAVTTIASSFSMPIWSITVKAYSEKNREWIARTQKKLAWIFGLICFVALIMPLVLQFLFDFVLGSSTFPVSYWVAFCFSAWAIAHSALYLESGVANGIVALKSQLIILFIGAVLKIPLIYYLSLNWAGDNSWISVIAFDSIVAAVVDVFQLFETKAKMRKMVSIK